MTYDQDSFPRPEALSEPMRSVSGSGYAFGQRVRSRRILWARHVGSDILAKADTPVFAIGDGTVVWSEMRAGREGRPNWGGIVILGHVHKKMDTPFYSLYGHIKGISCKVGDLVSGGDQLGSIAGSRTPENGWWKLPHLHFALYIGPWTGHILPGYVRPFEKRTKFRWWRDPHAFIREYNEG